MRWPFAVIAFWIAMAVALPLTMPNLNDMAQKNPLAMLPADAPSSVTAQEMTKGFQETGTDDLLLVVLSDERGLGPDQEAVYRRLVDALRDNSDDVVMLQDFIETPTLRSFLASKDGKAWVIPMGLAGALGTPRAYASFTRVSEIVAAETAGSSLQAHLAGPAATVRSAAAAGEGDRRPTEIAAAALGPLGLLGG
ncbi:MAG: MMPL family transporter [Mycobacterium sp.]|nr:MMPL family transporter [Mycobacterium sp.]